MRPYRTSETDAALYPQKGALVKCPCGTRFPPRVVVPAIGTEDDPGLCLTCNRRHWSKLHGYGGEPIAASPEISAAIPAVAHFRKGGVA